MRVRRQPLTAPKPAEQPPPDPRAREAELAAVESELGIRPAATRPAGLGADLVAELERSRLEEERKRAQAALANPAGSHRPIEFESANRPQGERGLRPDLQRVVDTIVLEEDVDAVWKRLEKALRVGERRSESGVLAEALDEAETNARLAHRLYITARLLHDEWELENGHVFGKMRDEAVRSLQREKDEGARSKQITDADIEARCASLYEDEWRGQQMRRKKSKATVESLQNLSENWSSRCKSLQTLYGKSR